MSLETLKHKLIDHLDFNFLKEIEGRLPYVNAYYLVCLVEVLHRYLDEGKSFDSYDTAFNTLLAEATALYQTANISEALFPSLL